MYDFILRKLLEQGSISSEKAQHISNFELKRPFSLHWELKTLLYLGVLLLNIGLGYIIYENIDSIGHAAIIALIGAISMGCFWYARRHRPTFSLGEVETPTPFYDYILLLGCLTFLIMEGYWQYQYEIFGTRYGLATFIPMVIFFVLAYRLDNRGVLSLGITALAAWAGITVTPQYLLTQNDFNSANIIDTGAMLGILFTLIPFLSERRGVKKHFSLTYMNFGAHLLMISALAGMMALGLSVVYFPLLCFAVGYYLWYARKEHSFYFLTLSVLYGYIGVTYLIFVNFDGLGLDFWFYSFYFMLSCAGVIIFLTNYKKFFKKEQP